MRIRLFSKETIILATIAILAASSSPLLALPPEPPPLVRPLDSLAFNCYLYVKSKIPSLPLTKDLVPNTTFPIKGGVVILDYKGTPHYAVTPEWATDEGILVDESNYKKGTYTKRFLSWKYLREHNAKYWKP